MTNGSIAVRRPVAFTAAVLCLSLAADAQQRAPLQSQPTFRADVELVQIDVVVVDQNGAHVRGLKASDFVVRDRGKPQTVAAFEEISHERPARTMADAAAPPPPPPARLDVSSNQTAAADRLVVLVVDDLHLWRGRTATAQSIARGILDRLGPDASMAVLFTSGERSTQVTEDRALLRNAIDTLKGRQSVRRPNQAVDGQRTKPNDPEASMDAQLANIQASQDVSLQQFADNMSLFTTLEEAARMMGQGDARRKAFVLVSEGISKNPTGIFGSMRETPQAPAGGAAYAATGDAAATIVPPPTAYHDLALIDMMEAMRRSNVATYAIDPRGEVTSEERALELHPEPVSGDPIFRWNDPLRIAQDGLTTIAEASGGFAVVNTDDFASGVERILDDLDHYYLLGFYPADPKRKGYRRLDVNVPGHPDWIVRFRSGYQVEGGQTKETKNQTPLVALSAGVLPKTDLDLRVGAVPLALESARETRVAVTLEVSVDRSSLEDPDGKLRDELTYEILAVDEKHKTVKHAGGLKARVTLSPSGAGPPVVATYQVADTISLPPGAYQLRVAAQSIRLKKGGSVYLNLDVPDFRRAPVTIGGMAIGYAAGARVTEAPPIARPTPAQRSARMVIAPPVPALPFPATLDRAFTTDDVLRVYLEVAGGGGRAERIPGRLEVLAADGKTPQSSVDFTSDDRGRVNLTLPLGNLDPGPYILRATVGTGSQAVTRDVGFSIADAR
ncbi:MAG: VWA domain-containing protein [Vicinamibacterales bacterium]